MTNLPSSRMQTGRPVFLAAIVLSLALSAWGAYAQQIPNPDALYYLRAAELFHSGQWQQGFALYRWPFYSLMIAGVMTSTGVTAPIAAQAINALFDCATVVIFIALVKQLAIGGAARHIVGWAACIIILHPKLVVLRPMVIRDHGYHAFFLLSLYLVVRDYQCAERWVKPAIACSIAAAALFRLEALLLAVVVPAFYIVTGPSAAVRRLLTIVFVLIAGLVLALLYTLWTSRILMGTAVDSVDAELFARLRDLVETFRSKAAQLSQVVPPVRNAGIVAYVGFAVAAFVDALVRALTIPLGILAIFAFTPRRLLSVFAARFVLWFAGWQVALLLAFTLVTFFIDWRFATVFALIMTIPVAFVVAEVAALWRARLPAYRLIFPIVLLAAVVPWGLEMQRLSRLEHLRDAGYWLNRNLPPHAKVLTNDWRIAYFSGRAFPGEVVLRTNAETTGPTVEEVDYVAVVAVRNTPPSFVTRELQGRVIAKIEGTDDRSVVIYKAR